MNTNGIRTTKRRLSAALLLMTFLFALLTVRLATIQLVDGASLTRRAAEQWYRDLPLKAKRGAILDRNGKVIVDSRDVFTVYVRPRAVTEPARVAAELSAALGADEDKLLENIRKVAVSEITVKKGVDFDTGSRLRELGMKGVYFSVDSARNYPHSSYLTQVVGYTNVDNEGQNGLEGYYDRFLRGVDGVAATPTDNKGIELDGYAAEYIPAIPGATLRTGLDIDIQGFAEDAVKSAAREWQAASASMIVMDVRTGAITAMARTPSYDLEDIPRDDIDMLNAFSKNTMIVDVYEPGSTFKIFTTAAALETGAVSDSSTFFCPGYRLVDGQRIKCWRSIGHGSQHLAEGVMNSCNCVFMDLALRMGTEKFYSKLRDFGFGSRTGVDFFSESPGLLMKESAVKTVDLARIGFGQAVAVTPLQLLGGVCAVVGGGVYHTPHFVESIVGSDGSEIYSFRDEPRRVLGEQISAKMRVLLENVVASGSGKKAAVPGYRIGGKTGTAQKYSGGAIAQGKYVSSFVGFAPADDPRYAILMIVDEPSAGAYYGSIVAAPYVGRVLGRIFDAEGIAPAADETEREYVTMPYLDSKGINESVNILDSLGLLYEIAGEGERVESTLPIVGERVEKGDVVLLRTE